MKHFCLLELAHDSESPMIGTINNIANSPQHFSSFQERAIKAIEEHFDAKVTQGKSELYGMLHLLFEGSPYEDIEINTENPYEDGGDDYLHKIRILETWMY